MSLATRVSLFFLGSLAVVLAGFSLALCLLASRHLDEQQRRQAESALAALTAAIEIKPGSVEWEPHERRLDLHGVNWAVRDPQGRIVGSSDAIPSEEGRHWARLRSRIASAGPARDALPPPEHAWLDLEVAAPADRASLRWLGGTLAVLSLAVWGVAALVGRRLCLRTLAPVARMARSARSIRADEPGQRLEVSPTGDELEELGRSFNGVLDRSQEAFERQRRFTGEASHQLRTPLAVLLGQIEVALRRERSPEEYRRVLGVVADQAGRLQRAVEMLLFLARADAEAASPALAPLALRPWLERHLESWATHPRAEDLRLGEGGAGLRVLAHAPLLAQAVDILLDNALKYGPPASPVVVSLRADGGSALLAVEDAGSGIDAADLPRVFEPFFRAPRRHAEDAGGVGLGLAIARRIVEAAGGSITAESEPGRGSRFTMRLPLAPEDGTHVEGS